jgi:hypothetical protein
MASDWGGPGNMWYSLIQQIIRQDPVYYALVVAARPDTNWRLISYTYYRKSTLDDENTGFSHLGLGCPPSYARTHFDQICAVRR